MKYVHDLFGEISKELLRNRLDRLREISRSDFGNCRGGAYLRVCNEAGKHKGIRENREDVKVIFERLLRHKILKIAHSVNNLKISDTFLPVSGKIISGAISASGAITKKRCGARG